MRCNAGLTCTLNAKTCASKSPFPQVFPLVPQRTQVIPLPVLDEDEGSIIGNINVIENIIKDFLLNDDWLATHIIPVVGDAFTATLQRRAIERHEDDRSKHPIRDKLDFLQPWAAFFHLQFAYQKYLLDTHSGTSLAMDMLSIRKAASKSGFRNLTTGVIDFHDVDGFMHLDFAAMAEVIVSSALRRAGHGDGEAGDRTLVPDASEDQTRIGDNNPASSPSPDQAPQREEAAALPSSGRRDTDHTNNEFANLEWDDLHQAASSAITALFSGSVARAAGATEGQNLDEVFGHAVSFFRDVSVYIELRHAIKHGDPGRVMAMLRQCLPRFQAGGHHRYVVEDLEMQMSVRSELPPALKTVMLAATLINHHGRADSFLAADLDIEHMVHDLKHVFPVQGKAGGHERQRRIGQLLPLLRSCKAQLFRAFAISSMGSKHAKRDRSLTVKQLASELEAFAVFEQQTEGRSSPIFEFKAGDKRAAEAEASGSAAKKGKQAKHVTTDAVVSSLGVLMGSSSKPGTVEAYFNKKRDFRLARIPADQLPEKEVDDNGVIIMLDAERDMGGAVLEPAADVLAAEEPEAAFMAFMIRSAKQRHSR
ncbi:hypothetical protein V8E36_004705 [Tilletia maclaganii]